MRRGTLGCIIADQFKSSVFKMLSIASMAAIKAESEVLIFIVCSCAFSGMAIKRPANRRIEILVRLQQRERFGGQGSE